jgi:hypothetical protein
LPAHLVSPHEILLARPALRPVCSCLRARPVSPPGFLPAVRRVVGEPINESRVVGEPIVIQDRQFCFLETKIHFLGNKNLFPRIIGNENSFPTYLIVTRPRVPPRQSCRNLRFAGISSGTPPIYHILEKCIATFSSYLSLKRNPVFGASAQRISRSSYTAVVALTATCKS